METTTTKTKAQIIKALRETESKLYKAYNNDVKQFGLADFCSLSSGNKWNSLYDVLMNLKIEPIYETEDSELRKKVLSIV